MMPQRKSTLRTGLLCLLAVALAPLLHATSGKSALDLDLRLAGTAFVQGKCSALVEDVKSGEQNHLALDSEIKGYMVAEIHSDRIVLAHGKERMSLFLNQSQIKAEPAVPRLHAIPCKTSAPAKSPKTKTHKALPYLKTRTVPDFMRPMEGRVTSGYGARQNPMGPSKKMHYGVDIAAPHGTKIRAAADGVVRDTGKYWPRGRYVEITHKNGYTTHYYHLYKDIVHDGQKVKRGDVIGYEGETGNCTGPHLHFEIQKYGIAKDPALYLPDMKK